MGLSNRLRSLAILFILISTYNPILSYDNAHFYRATFFFGEPRFEKEKLTTFDLVISGGSAFKGYDSCGNKTCFLDIYGPNNMQFLGKNLPRKCEMERESEKILANLLKIPTRECFGNFSFFGEFRTWEIYFSIIQNFKKGFFTHVHIPIRKLEIFPVIYCDLSPDDQEEPNSRNPYWREFIQKFNYILSDFNLSANNFCASGPGDVSFMLGWTKNHEKTEYIDFIDGTIRAGISLPTSKERNENCAFSMPLGYNGHLGFNICADISLGLYEWLTFGIHTDVIFFNTITKSMRIKTACEQNGFIKLAKERVRIKKGNLYNAGFFLKADHAFLGSSLILGYIFSLKQNDHLTFCRTCGINSKIANNDEMLKKWSMNTLNFILEYDFTKEDHKFGPRVSIFYNHVAGGKRIIKTHTGGIGFGFEVVWDL